MREIQDRQLDGQSENTMKSFNQYSKKETRLVVVVNIIPVTVNGTARGSCIDVVGISFSFRSS